MDNFKDYFFGEDATDLVEEASEITQDPLFSLFGRDFVNKRFDHYDDIGLIPQQVANLNGDTRDIDTKELTEHEKKQLKIYIFKNVDREVLNQAIRLVGDEDAGLLHKHYSDLKTFDVDQNSERINKILKNFMFFKRQDIAGLPKTLSKKINLDELDRLTKGTKATKE